MVGGGRRCVGIGVGAWENSLSKERGGEYRESLYGLSSKEMQREGKNKRIMGKGTGRRSSSLPSSQQVAGTLHR